MLLFVHIARAAGIAIRAGWTGTTASATGERITLQRIPRVAEILGGFLVLATLAIPPLLPLLPLTVAVVTLVALISGRLSWPQAIVVAAALVIAVLAYRQIQFPLPFLSAEMNWFSHGFAFGPEVSLAIGAILTAVFFAILIAMAKAAVPRGIFIAATFVCGALLTGLLFQQHTQEHPAGLAATLTPAAEWARANTPPDTIFLTPTGYSAFRLLADRGLVADWRDGTQLYFSGQFGPEWFDRMTNLEPGLTLSPDNSRLVARGKSLDTLDTDALLALAKKYHATYILLPTPPPTAADHVRSLQVAFSDANFTAYMLKPPAVAATGPNAVPKGVIHPADWAEMQKFIHTTVAENIEKYRKSDLTVQIVDPAGHPVQDLVATVNQTRHLFNFGVSLGFFEPNDIFPEGDEKGEPVTPQELALMPTCFNASMIPFSGKWLYTEPVKDQPSYSDLDKYIGFCAAHNITVEYHFLAGLAPAWLHGNEAEAVKRLSGARDGTGGSLSRPGDVLAVDQRKPPPARRAGGVQTAPREVPRTESRRFGLRKILLGRRQSDRQANGHVPRNSNDSVAADAGRKARLLRHSRPSALRSVGGSARDV